MSLPARARSIVLAWYSASQKLFENTLKIDPNCAIAYWGIALSLLDNPLGSRRAMELKTDPSL
jgi:hypothetical protein